jgi:hypothetical protein
MRSRHYAVSRIEPKAPEDFDGCVGFPTDDTVHSVSAVVMTLARGDPVQNHAEKAVSESAERIRAHVRNRLQALSEHQRRKRHDHQPGSAGGSSTVIEEMAALEAPVTSRPPSE